MAKKDRKPGRLFRSSFWRQWGVYLILAGLIVVGGVVLQMLRKEPREISADSRYRLYFTQSQAGAEKPEKLEGEIIADIAHASEQVDLVTPGLDLERISDALIAAHGRGVQVRVLEDASTQSDPPVAEMTARLQEAGIEPVLRQAEGELGGAFLVVDRRITWIGSWELSQQALTEDLHYVLRFDLVPLANDFGTEFEEMYTDGAFGTHSTRDTPQPYLSLVDAGQIYVYFSPDDDPLEQVMVATSGAENSLLLMMEGVDLAPAIDRLKTDAHRPRTATWGLFDAKGPSSLDTLYVFEEAGMGLRVYSGAGRLRENLIIVDNEVVFLLSQPFTESSLEQNDGYVLVIWDPALIETLQGEFERVYDLSKALP